MIGVIADAADHEIVREFFELFKTPWELYREGRQYEVLLYTKGRGLFANAKLVLIYSGTWGTDGESRAQVHPPAQDRVLRYRGRPIPIYGPTTTFFGKSGFLVETSGKCAGYAEPIQDGTQCRIGYDLFYEVRHLLTTGQPVANAAIPTLEHHIALLRELIIDCGVRLIEIPPVPDGYNFIACLTHDVDHPAIRFHRWDHTAWGFVSRAIFGSLRNFVRGCISSSALLRNLVAACKLPFVYLGLAKDFWMEFADRYLELEGGLPSTFFVIPFRDRQGRNTNGAAPTFRAAKYGAWQIVNTIQKLLASGCEIGLHGIDAWLDQQKASEEVNEIRRLCGKFPIGTRMHWLYFGPQSPLMLEQAGVKYDSTIGYNETVGYRAGTGQVYRSQGATRLLELPLHAMDTALFYKAYLGLSPERAKIAVMKMLDTAVQFGGCCTINWHDRSVAPERLWGDTYSELIREMKVRGAWFATASNAVSWFEKRRFVEFGRDRAGAEIARFAGGIAAGATPLLRMRTHGPVSAGSSAEVARPFFDEPIGEPVCCEASQC